jgi:surface protein
MFQGATNFNQALSNWDVGNVTNMTAMFSGANAFNKNVSNWCVIQIPSEPANFAMANFQTGYRPHWGECESFAEFNRPFVTTWRTTTANETVIIYGNGAGYSYTIDW